MIKSFEDFTNSGSINELFNASALKNKDEDELRDLVTRLAATLKKYTGDDLKDTLEEIEQLCKELRERDLD